MSETSTTVTGPPLRPLPYQRVLCEHLKCREPKAWAHFASRDTRETLAAGQRLGSPTPLNGALLTLLRAVSDAAHRRAD